jgi:hypothetical protein
MSSFRSVVASFHLGLLLHDIAYLPYARETAALATFSQSSTLLHAELVDETCS